MGSFKHFINQPKFPKTNVVSLNEPLESFIVSRTIQCISEPLLKGWWQLSMINYKCVQRSRTLWSVQLLVAATLLRYGYGSTLQHSYEYRWQRVTIKYEYGPQSPINYENSLKKVSGLSWPEHIAVAGYTAIGCSVSFQSLAWFDYDVIAN